MSEGPNITTLYKMFVVLLTTQRLCFSTPSFASKKRTKKKKLQPEVTFVHYECRFVYPWVGVRDVILWELPCLLSKAVRSDPEKKNMNKIIIDAQQCSHKQKNQKLTEKTLNLTQLPKMSQKQQFNTKRSF